MTVPFHLRWILELLSTTMPVQHRPPSAVGTVPPIVASVPIHFDATSTALRDRTAFKKRTAGTRQLDTVDTLVVHQTAVEFGVSRRAVEQWRRLLNDGKWATASIARSYGTDVAEELALHERFWNTVPYHFASLLNGDVLHVHPLTWRTWHAGHGNYGVGWAQEGLFPSLANLRRPRHTELSDHVVEVARSSMRVAVLKSRELGCPIRRVQPHRCYSLARGGDTGEEVWRRVVLPVAEELDLKPDYELKLGGLQISRDWDDAAMYDSRGRRLAA